MRYASITERLADLGSGKWAVHFRARAMAAEGAEVLELTIGEPDIPPEKELLDECSRAMHAGRTRYSAGRGDPALLDVLAEKYTRRSGRTVTPENVLCFPGTQTALFAVMTGLVETGDEVLVADPLYATYEGVIRANGAELRSVPLYARNRFHLDPADLEKAITPRCRVLLLNSPHNPTGAVLSRDELKAIGEVCRRHDLWIVSDEVYEELVFEGAFASPFDIPELAECTIAVASISKSHAAPGFRSGWAVGPQEFCERLLPVSETMLFGGQPFIADMTAYALSRPSPAAARMREAYHRRAQFVTTFLGNTAGARPIMPEGGMFILLDVRDSGLTGEDFAWGLLESEGVAVMPGASFGEEARGFVRVSLTVPDERMEEACARIARFAANAVAPKRAGGWA
ncbi:pyridoxal phosphate-dependent aminotransferase [Afifella sp. YEN Y35]|uniref:pyridoxal phosphate-dependent aminotransferase n=1 Tax=Afifella sp. YEN Y35 TaxID=3388337 RepID=UPI0039E16A8B